MSRVFLYLFQHAALINHHKPELLYPLLVLNQHSNGKAVNLHKWIDPIHYYHHSMLFDTYQNVYSKNKSAIKAYFIRTTQNNAKNQYQWLDTACRPAKNWHSPFGPLIGDPHQPNAKRHQPYPHQSTGAMILGTVNGRIESSGQSLVNSWVNVHSCCFRKTHSWSNVEKKPASRHSKKQQCHHTSHSLARPKWANAAILDASSVSIFRS